jgi:hypothetical protein
LNLKPKLQALSSIKLQLQPLHRLDFYDELLKKIISHVGFGLYDSTLLHKMSIFNDFCTKTGKFGSTSYTLEGFEVAASATCPGNKHFTGNDSEFASIKRKHSHERSPTLLAYVRKYINHEAPKRVKGKVSL